MEKKKVKAFQSKWFLWFTLLLFPPLGISVLWAYHKNMNVPVKVVLTMLSVGLFIVIWLPLLQAAATGIRAGFREFSQGQRSN